MYLGSPLVVLSALLLSTTSANPLAKRSGETNYLVNCALGGTTYSEMDYYSNGANSQNGQQPDDTCEVDVSGYETWEGHSVSCTYQDSGVTFTSNIYSGAQSQPNYSKAGTGQNNYHSFNCYKDNGRLLFTKGEGVMRSFYVLVALGVIKFP
ncbi:hypothetical protein MMC12_003319 [Toensbergia leucococca]|nr:hypothetical protein [Toensbergia leucococca]